MPMGYLGYAEIANKRLLATSAGVNRKVAPIKSEAVWGAGWYNATTTNYADNQVQYEGDIKFQLQGIPEVWNLIRDWAIEERVFPQSARISPDGITVQDYTFDGTPRSGLWLSTMSMDINPEQAIECSTGVIGLKRTETQSSSSYTVLREPGGRPIGPLNPTPRNLNPIPGWAAKAVIGWNGSPPSYSDDNPTGFAMLKGSINLKNNTKIVRACSGQRNPLAVLQGTMEIEGDLSLWRDGGIPDPYGSTDLDFETFSASASSVQLILPTGLYFSIPHLLLEGETYGTTGPNELVSRSFKFSGLGNGDSPPLYMSVA